MNWGMSQEVRTSKNVTFWGKALKIIHMHMQYCWNQGSRLAEFYSAEEEQLITQYLYTDFFYWIGLTDMANEGSWRWAETHKVPEYQFWGNNEPDGGTRQNCAYKAMSSKHWADNACSLTYISSLNVPIHALCQVEK